jgi:hypothetical protein
VDFVCFFVEWGRTKKIKKKSTKITTQNDVHCDSPNNSYCARLLGYDVLDAGYTPMGRLKGNAWGNELILSVFGVLLQVEFWVK